MQKIVPHLWFDKEAKEAAAFYVSVFGGDSKVGSISELSGTPSGDTDIVPFTLWGFDFLSISAGPYFKPTPAISFMVNFDPSQDPDAAKKIDEVWAKLSEGGKVMMDLGEYPFSKRYGWVADKYGFTWQLILTDPEGDDRPRIIPSLQFVNEKCGKAEEAIKFYLSVFKESKLGTLAKYDETTPISQAGSVMFADFKLLDTWFAAMDSAGKHEFDFNEAVSLIVNCEDQAEIDYYWEKLSAVPESEQCGWLKDKFGVSWQITPTRMDEMMASGDKAAIERVTKAFLQMKKFNLAELEKAFEG
jgi:predicted 3-demethylubiquinone-9 3-methyltransferase (glyoxalase superfamily)